MARNPTEPRWDDPQRVAQTVGDWSADVIDPDSRVLAIERLSGHSASTWAVSLGVRGASRNLVVKLSPPGIGRRGEEVVHQGNLLRALRAAGLRVPVVVASGDHHAFPGSHLVMERARGATLGNVFLEPLGVDPGRAHPLFVQAVAELVRIHTVSPTGMPLARRTAREEVLHWRRVLERGHDAHWIGVGDDLHRRLLDTLPDDGPTGLVHGDFYSNNWLFDRGRLTAVVDWEASTMGPQSLDVAWLCLFHDRRAWGPSRRRLMAGTPDPAWMLATYRRLADRPVDDLPWYVALAAFRLASLVTYYLRLHRTGRRPDSAWNVLGDALPFLLARADEALTRGTYPSAN